MESKALVTGGTGFLGQVLVKKLIEDNWHVIILSRSTTIPARYKNISEITFIPISSIATRAFGENIRDMISHNKPDIVFHLAAAQPKLHKFDDISDLLVTNIHLGLYLLEAIRAFKKIPFINTGTYWQYGGGEVTNPVNLYSATKNAFNELIKYYTNEECNSIASLILVDTYGEFDNRKKIIDIILDAALKNQSINLSPGYQELDFLHASDVASGMIHAGNRLLKGELKNGSYALSSGKTINLHSLAKIIADVTGQNPNINWGGIPYAPHQIMKSYIPFSRLPNWEPKITLHEGIKKLVQSRNIK